MSSERARMDADRPSAFAGLAGLSPSDPMDSARLMGVITALAAEVYVLKAELTRLTIALESGGATSEQALAEVSKHLAPVHLSTELDRRAQGRSYPIYITHTKPAETGRIMAEIAPLSQPQPDGSVLAIHWLSAGQVFEV